MSNLLFVTIDDLFSLSAWPLYDGIVQTPNLDALAAQGVNFDAAYADVALCNPSRAAILTGQTPWQTGMLTNSQDLSQNVDIGADTLPGMLKAAGYEVTLGGKVFHSVPANEIDQVADNLLSPTGLRNTSAPIYDNVGNLFYGAAQEPLLDSDLAARASDYMATLDGTVPQALFLGIYRPHADWVVPQEFIDLYAGIDIPIPDFVDDAERDEFAQAFNTTVFHDAVLQEDAWEDLVRHYLASVSYADAILGQMLDALEASAIADDTVVMVMSDHGYHLGDAGNWHKFTTHEQSARAPLILAAPGMDPATITAPVNLSSVAATALELLDLTPTPEMQPSLLPLIHDGPTGEEQAVTWMNGSLSLRTETHRYVRYEEGQEDLFDLTTDIYAQNDIAESDPEQLALMRAAAEEALDGLFINPDEPVTGDAGDTTYYLREQLVPVTDLGGTDLVLTNTDYTLPDEIENVSAMRAGRAVLFTGNALDNRITSGLYDDTIRGEAGNDSVFAGGGHDVIDGGAGDDSILSSSGNDTAYGGDGSDTLIGGHGRDVFTGNLGADLLLGQAGNDSLDGGEGADTLEGSSGNDVLIGGNGDDHFDDGPGVDTIEGGDGNDTLRLGTGRDTFEGGAGQDLVEIDLRIESLEQGTHVTNLVTGRSGPVDRPNQNDMLVDVEALRFWGAFDVTVIGSAADNSVETADGADSVDGGDGADTLIGGDGDDTLTGGADDDLLEDGSGTDMIEGGDGDDTLRLGTGRDTFEGGPGQDLVEIDLRADSPEQGAHTTNLVTGVSGPVANPDQSDLLIDVEALRYFGDFDVTVTGSAADNHVETADGADSVHGGQGADTLMGGGGDDSLTGGTGDDLLMGDAGQDLLRGGPGGDALYGATEDDRLFGQSGDDLLDGGDGRDLLNGGGGGDTLIAGGSQDWVVGGRDDDSLLGQDGNDMLAGRRDGDTLDGGLGDDLLRGGGGDDVLRGGAGNDRLKGGTGADVFHFNTVRATGADRIVDFDLDEDVLRLIGVQFEDLTIVEIGENVSITWETGQVTVNGVSPDALTSDVLVFG